MLAPDKIVTVTGVRGQSVTLSYNFLSPTTSITQCRLRKLPSSANHNLEVLRLTGTFNCWLTGRPPDLNLTVVMQDVSDTDQGMWQLEVTNGWGTCTVNFSLLLSNGILFVIEIILVDAREYNLCKTVTKLNQK